MATKKQAESKPKRTTKKAVAPVALAAPEVVPTTVEVVEMVGAQPAPIEVDAPPAERPAPAAEAIRARAFQLWQARGGTAFDNWLAAEWELRGEG